MYGISIEKLHRVGKYIIHTLESELTVAVGETVNCHIDIARRKQLAQHHTGAHIVGAAARKVLGNHINQAGAHKKKDQIYTKELNLQKEIEYNLQWTQRLNEAIYDDRVKARIGGMENSGLSFIPDAMKLATRMLEDDVNERRYLFLITDGVSMGYHQINEEFQSAVKMASKAGINVVAIGVPDGMSKYFTISFPHTEVRKTVAKFVNAYSSIAQQMM